MERLAGIHQLHYLPWLRYFEKIARCDVFVVLDTVQFVKNEWHNRNKIKASSGEQILTVPVQHSHLQGLHEVQIDNRQSWQRKHWASLQQNYSKAEFSSLIFPTLHPMYHDKTWTHLNSLNRAMLQSFVQALGIDTELVFASELPATQVQSSERLVELCQQVEADSYYCGRHAAENYLDQSLFQSAGIEVVMQDWTCPVYRQQEYKNSEFIPDLAIIDLLSNAGPESLNLLLSGAKTA